MKLGIDDYPNSKEALNEIIAYDGTPAEAKALAEIVLEFNHIASEESTAILANL